MNKKLGLLASALMVLSLAGCGGNSEATPAESSVPDQTAASTKTSTKTSTRTRTSTSKTSAVSKSQEATQEYYALPFNYFEGSTHPESDVWKWDKGKDYKWTFNVEAAAESVTMYIGAQMSSSSHSSRTLFTNSSGADSSDTFESNSANNGTPRVSIKANGVDYALTNKATYGECGLDANNVNYLKLTSFPLKAGENVIIMHTHAETGYRLMVGGDVRLYFAGEKWDEPFKAGDGVFSNLTTFSEPQEFLTEKQAQLVAYDGDYAALTESDMQNYASGRETASEPKPVHVSWNHNPKSQSYHYEVEVSKGAEFNAEGALVYNVGEKKSADLSNFLPGESYAYRVKCVYGDSTPADVADPITFSMRSDDLLIRPIAIQGMTNCRDLGGKTLENGSKFKYGMIYRTGACNDSISGAAITPFGIAQMKQWLGIKAEIDLRGGANGKGGVGTESIKSTTVSDLGDGVNLAFSPLAYEGGKNLIYRNIEPIRKVFKALGDENNYPVFFHCRIGTDRTGAIAMLINGLLGVPMQQIYLDYLFSNFGNIGKNPIIGGSGDDSVIAYVNDLMALPGETFSAKVYNFLLSIGVEASELDTLIRMATDGENKTVNPNKVTVKKAADAVLEGVSLTSSTEHRMAPSYVALSSETTKATFTVDAQGTSNLIAKIYSSNASATIDGAFKVTIDGVEQALETTSFATDVLGLGGDFWIPAVLAKNVSLSAGEHTIAIEGKGVAVNLEHIALQYLA